jgi:hypothetical protein
MRVAQSSVTPREPQAKQAGESSVLSQVTVDSGRLFTDIGADLAGEVSPNAPRERVLSGRCMLAGGETSLSALLGTMENKID